MSLAASGRRGSGGGDAGGWSGGGSSGRRSAAAAPAASASGGRQTAIDSGRLSPSAVPSAYALVMSESAYSVLHEILSRAEAILRSAPSGDRALSFLRLLAAYDQIMLRHDVVPRDDVEVYPWLVTLNIETEEETRQAAAGGGGKPARSKEYSVWKRKLDQLFEAGEQSRKSTKLAQLKETAATLQRNLSALSHAPARHDQGELSIESLSSGASSFMSPHVTFATDPVSSPSDAASLRTSTGFGVLKGAAKSQSLYEDDVSDDSHAASLRRSSGRSHGDSLSKSSDDDNDERVFLDLLRLPGRQRDDPVAVVVRQNVHACFQSWRLVCRPHFHQHQRAMEHRRTRATRSGQRCWAEWRRSLIARRYQRYLDSLLHIYQLSVQRNLLNCWRQELHRRQALQSHQRAMQAGSAWQHWRKLYAEAMRTKQLHFVAVRNERALRWKFGLIQWARFCQMRKRLTAERRIADDFYAAKLLARTFSRWCLTRVDNAQYLRQSQTHLLNLRKHQSLLLWLSRTRLLHTPAHQSTLTVQQFHILWRWLQRSFGSGYDVMRIIWLSKMQYQPHTEPERQSDAEQQAPQPAQPNPTTHPFVAGPAATFSFAATAAAPFAVHEPLPSSFAQSLPYRAFSPDASGAGGALSASPVLGSPVSALEVPAAPHPAGLPMEYAILQLLGRSLHFRSHKLPQLLAMIQLWARWYLKHLFQHWRANIAQKKALRIGEKKRAMLIAADEHDKESRAVAVHSRAVLSRALERWQDSFHKASYYSLLLQNFYLRQRRRAITAHYAAWKFAFVAVRARAIFRVRRGLAAWKRFMREKHRTHRKYGLIQITRQRGLQALVWQHWRLALQRNQNTRRGMLGLLWRKWKETLEEKRRRRAESRDAEGYYCLKLLLRSLLTWRAQSITATIAGKYAHNAIHHYHSTLSHRHVVQWVNWKRYRADSRRLADYGRSVFLNKLKFVAVKMWREQAASRSYRHKQYMDCKAGVRNKFLAAAALASWRYALACLLRTRRIRHNATIAAQRHAWQLWLQCIRSKNAQYDTLETHVHLRRDFNSLGALFSSWQQASVVMRRARKLRKHCETVWYYALVKRLFRGWKFVAHDLHQAQMVQAQDNRVVLHTISLRRTGLRLWRSYVSHRRSYSVIVRRTHERLCRHKLKEVMRVWSTAWRRQHNSRVFLKANHTRRFVLAHWKAWRAALEEERSVADKTRFVWKRQSLHVLRAVMKRWAGPFVTGQRACKAALDKACETQRLAQLRAALEEWKVFRREARLVEPASHMRRGTLLGRCWTSWRATFLEQHRGRRAADRAQAYDIRRVTGAIYRAWKSSIRTKELHRHLLYKKTFLAWRRYVLAQAEQLRRAQLFKDSSIERKLRFAWGKWERFLRLHARKHRRRLAEVSRRSNAQDMDERIGRWHAWSSARGKARDKIAAMKTRVSEDDTRQCFAHWWTLFQQTLLTRSLHLFAARAFKQSALQHAVARWKHRAKHQAHSSAIQAQARAISAAFALRKAYSSWTRSLAMRRQHFSAVVKQLGAPRLRRLYLRWRSLTGRKTAIVRLHTAFLRAALETWRDHARESHRERVWVPRADAMHERAMLAAALRHWAAARRLHHGWTRVWPKTQHKLKSTALSHWRAMLELQERANEFAERVAQTHAKRRKAHAIQRFQVVVAARHHLANQFATLRSSNAAYTALRFVRRWRQGLVVLRSRYQQAIAWEAAHPDVRMQRSGFAAWRAAFLYRVESHRIRIVGERHEQRVTHVRRTQERVNIWSHAAAYAVHTRQAKHALTDLARHAAKAKAFGAWQDLFRKLCASRRMQRLLARSMLTQAMHMWQRETNLQARFEITAERSALAVQLLHFRGWIEHQQKRVRARLAVHHVQSRMAARASHGRGAPWRESVVSVLKQWMDAGSSVRFYMNVWRRYRQQCRSYRDASAFAAVHFQRRVLMPATWREWKQAQLESQQARAARACRLKHARMRFLAGLGRMMERRFLRLKQVAQAEEYQRRLFLKHAWCEWRRDTLQILEDRAAAVFAAQLKYFSAWRNKFLFQTGMARKTIAANSFHQQHLVKNAHSHWKSYWQHLGDMESRSAAFTRKLDLWHLGRLFTTWLDHHRHLEWRRQRVVLITQAVRHIWQKNALLAWSGYVRAVHTQRRHFLLTRVLLSWKYCAQRERSRRHEVAAGEHTLQELESARLEAIPAALRQSRIPAPARSRARSEERSLDFGRSSSASVWPLDRAAASRRPALSTDDLEDFASTKAKAPFEYSASSSRQSPLTDSQQVWRMTPIRVGEGGSGLNASQLGSSQHVDALYRASSPTQSMRVRSSLIGSLRASPLAAASAALARSASPTSPSSPSPASPSRHRTPQKANGVAKSSRLTPPTSRSRRRQDELEAAERRKELMQARSPASNTFLEKLFAD